MAPRRIMAYLRSWVRFRCQPLRRPLPRPKTDRIPHSRKARAKQQQLRREQCKKRGLKCRREE